MAGVFRAAGPAVCSPFFVWLRFSCNEGYRRIIDNKFIKNNYKCILMNSIGRS